MQCLILPFEAKARPAFADTIPQPAPDSEWNPSGRDALDIYTTKAPNGDELIIVSLKKLEIQ